MNEKETLYERYENAFFALLMAEASELEGKALLEENKALLADPNAAVPEEITRRSLRTIEKDRRKTARQHRTRTLLLTLKRTAVVIAVACLLLVGVFAVSETARVNVINYVMEQLDVGTAFIFENDQASQLKTIADYRAEILPLIPEGFEMEICEEGSISNTYLFRNPDETVIEITDYRLSRISGTIVIDTEDADVQYETHHGQEVMLVRKKATVQIVWINENTQTMTIVRGEDASFDVLSAIAEQMILLQP